MPRAIPIAAPPDNELSPVVDAVDTVGIAVVVVGVVGPDGNAGENGLLPLFPAGTTAEPAEPVDPVEAASATTGAAMGSAPAISHTHASRRIMRRNYRSEASGCSIAGVSGAVRYGSSFS